MTSFKIGNNPHEISEFINHLKNTFKITTLGSVFGMEDTGVYCNHLINILDKLRANIVLENPLHIKKSLGLIRGKNDKADALRIAGFLLKGRDGLVTRNARREVIDDLARLSSLRNRLVNVEKVLATPLKEDRGFIKISKSDIHVELCKASLVSLKADIERLERYIQQVWSLDDKVNHLMQLITSVPGVGPITALQIIIATNEFKKISDPRKFACYCGVAPFEHSSGTSVRGKTRVSKIANRKLKTLLSACALSARRFVPEIKAYYERRTLVDKKHKMSVMNAIRFKIITRVFACVKREQSYQKNFKPIDAGHGLANSADS
ncbi:MAG: IS110 family transposase [Flavobacterium sp.]|nr:MAG: IS110 family transposase [Flavobacterium sp.]